MTEHTAHLFGVLPYLIALACPLMHVFMLDKQGELRYRQHFDVDSNKTSSAVVALTIALWVTASNR